MDGIESKVDPWSEGIWGPLAAALAPQASDRAGIMSAAESSDVKKNAILASPKTSMSNAGAAPQIALEAVTAATSLLSISSAGQREGVDAGANATFPRSGAPSVAIKVRTHDDMT